MTSPFGIPYASTRRDDDGFYQECPECRKRIRLTERKDFESMSGNEYVQHYQKEHSDASS